MMLDNTLMFSNQQAITADAASDKVVETLGDIGRGTPPIPLLIQVTEDFNNLTDLTVCFQTDETKEFTNPVTIVKSTLKLADLKAGARFHINYLPDGIKKYMRLYYDVTGTAPTKGKITAGIVDALSMPELA